ncbi:MAG: hypothetical protein H7144_15810 [Burkholderiales bacterium]|nr:hypothetical protein [Phycisphaerae bacterium]
MAENDTRGERIADALFGNNDARFAIPYEQDKPGPNFTAAFNIAEGVFVSDVTDHATRFYRQAALFEEIGEKMPCVPMGDFEYAPIEVFQPPYPLFGYPQFFSELRYLWWEEVRRSRYWAGLAGDGEKVRFFAPREALNFVKRGVSRFLSSRFSSISPQAAYAPVPFTLHNQNPNHQIYYSSPYYFQTSNVFGGPSTPVTQHLHPGIYVFGVMGSVVHNNQMPQFETTSHFDIPRMHTSGTLVTI